MGEGGLLLQLTGWTRINIELMGGSLTDADWVRIGGLGGSDDTDMCNGP